VTSRFLTFVIAIIVLEQGSCSSGGSGPTAPSCVTGLTADCKPLFDPPTYSSIFAQILQPTCAQGMGTCHTADAAMGGLVFQDPDQAYALLLGQGGGRARVNPGDPSCSLIIIRLESNDPTFRMPPGPTPLLESARCDMVQWIANGAAR
jgi:hypothetical protein